VSDSNELRDALRIAVPVEPEDKVAERRAALLSVIEREIYATPRRLEQEQKKRTWQRRGRILGVAAALLGTLGLGMLVSEFEGGLRTDAGANVTAPSTEGIREAARQGEQRLSLAGQSYETGAGHEKVLQMGGDTQVTLAAHTRVFVERDSENQQHLHLSSGGLLLSVPEHRKDRSVQVQTLHATVQVTGTIFGVEVGRFSGSAENAGTPEHAGTPARTRVRVERGQVVVVHAGGRIVLEPGDTWLSPLEASPSGAASANSASKAVEAPSTSLTASGGWQAPRSSGQTQASTRTASAKTPTPQAPRSDRSVVPEVQPSRATSRRDSGDSDSTTLRPLAPERARVLSSESAASEEASTLAAQNNLLERALSAEKQGNREQAAALIDRFLQRYPRSPLRASALAIKKRLN
jgi:hypothetical protein